MNHNDPQCFFVPTILPDGNGSSTHCPELMTEEELIRFLRIPEVSKADINGARAKRRKLKTWEDHYFLTREILNMLFKKWKPRKEAGDE